MFITGNSYTKKDIYDALEVPKERRRGAWDTGYTKFNGDIFIFINIGVPGRTGHDYGNHWLGADLVWYGKNKSNIDQPLIRQMLDASTNVYIFTREDDRHPFKYQGKGKAKTYEASSPVKITWTFKETKLIDPREAWRTLLLNAKIAYKFQRTYISPKQFHEYKIIKVTSDFIKIKRISTGTQTEQDLSYSIFESAIARINKQQGLLSRKELYGIVLIEAAIVWLLPILDYDDSFKYVVFDGAINGSILNRSSKPSLEEAQNDHEIRTVSRDLRIRRGQNKLRENLFYLYNEMCCITKTSVKEILHACHITPHSISGYNNTANALLLRSDIHDLFDSDLIGINPHNLKVVTSGALHKSEYAKFNGVSLSRRIDGKSPDIDALKQRWDTFRSTY